MSRMSSSLLSLSRHTRRRRAAPRAPRQAQPPAHFRGEKALSACLLLALAGISGCVSPLVTRTANFASAGAPTLSATRDAYTLVQSVQAGAATAERVSTWDTTSIDAPPPPSTFGTPDDLKARDEVLGCSPATSPTSPR